MDVADSPAPPVDSSTLLSQIIRDCFSEGQAANLALDSPLMNPACGAHQIVRVMEFSPTERDLKLSVRRPCI
jgi:hypothetical protein